MDKKLKMILICIIVLCLIYIFRAIKKNKLTTKNALIWIIATIGAIFSIIFIEQLLIFANFLGIKTVSNMLFFLGYIFLLILSFNLSNELSMQNKKIISLTQELGLLKNKISKESKENV